MGFIDGLPHFSCQAFGAGLHSAVTRTGLEISLKLDQTGQHCHKLYNQLNEEYLDTYTTEIFDGSLTWSDKIWSNVKCLITYSVVASANFTITSLLSPCSW